MRVVSISRSNLVHAPRRSFRHGSYLFRLQPRLQRFGRTDVNRVTFELAAIEFGALKDKPSKLANAGLLLATLFQGEAEIVQISMLTQIDKAADGALTRVIYDPLQ